LTRTSSAIALPSYGNGAWWRIYEAALEYALNDELRQEWEHYLEQTRNHVELVEDSLCAFGLDPAVKTPGREIVSHTGEALFKTTALARAGGSAEQAQVVDAECVTLAETKNHLNWELIGEVIKRLTGDPAKVLRAAHKEVEEQEDSHLYHNQVGPESSGSKVWASRRCCLRPKSKRTSRPRSVRLGPSKLART
jgi:hypothetical protein